MSRRLLCIFNLVAIMISALTCETSGSDAQQLAKESKSLAKVEIGQAADGRAILTISCENISTGVLPVLDRGKLPHCNIEVLDSNGKTSAWTASGKSFFSEENSMRTVSTTFRQVEPKKETQWETDLTHFFHLVPGVYTIKLDMTIWIEGPSGTLNDGEFQKFDLQLKSFIVK